jgi:hypothetical protein
VVYFRLYEGPVQAALRRRSRFADGFFGVLGVASRTLNLGRLEPLRARTVQGVFTYIYRRNAWRSGESLSGPGSTVTETRRLRIEIPRLMEELACHTLLIESSTITSIAPIAIARRPRLSRHKVRENATSGRTGIIGLYYYHCNAAPQSSPSLVGVRNGPLPPELLAMSLTRLLAIIRPLQTVARHAAAMTPTPEPWRVKQGVV